MINTEDDDMGIIELYKGRMLDGKLHMKICMYNIKQPKYKDQSRKRRQGATTFTPGLWFLRLLMEDRFSIVSEKRQTEWSCERVPKASHASLYSGVSSILMPRCRKC